MGSTFSSEMDRDQQSLNYQVPMSNHLFNDDVNLDDLPCMNCLRVEMGERACYSGICDMCGQTPPSLRWMYPNLGENRSRENRRQRNQARSLSHDRHYRPNLSQTRSESIDRPSSQRLNALRGGRRRMSVDSNVPKGLSTIRIELSTFTHNYRTIVGVDSEGKDKDNCSCTICMQAFSEDELVRRLGCLHMFHVACIDHWLALSSCCPVCRVDVETAAAQYKP